MDGLRWREYGVQHCRNVYGKPKIIKLDCVCPVQKRMKKHLMSLHLGLEYFFMYFLCIAYLSLKEILNCEQLYRLGNSGNFD